MVIFAPTASWALVFAWADCTGGKMRLLLLPMRGLVPGLLLVLGLSASSRLTSFSQSAQHKARSLVLYGHKIDVSILMPWLMRTLLLMGGAWLGSRRAFHRVLGRPDGERCLPAVARMSDAALSLRNVTKSFGSTEIIRGVSLDIKKGERHAIIGPNGAGKTTLFNLISGRFPISSGEILLNDSHIDELTPHQINRLGLSRSFQITSIFPKMSVFENLRCALLWSMNYRYSFWTPLWRQKELNEQTLAILDDLNLLPRRDVAAGLLSYADQRALEIGMTIAGGASVIMLDEPTAGMSNTETDNAVELIRRVSTGKTLVMVEHDMRVVFGLADVITVLVYGQVIASGPPQVVRANAAVQEAYLGALEAA